jgi:hypothetical protein
VQVQEVSKIRDAVLEHTLTDKNDKLTALKKVADEIFVPAATMKLALVSKVWGYDALYESCKARIVAEPLPHMSSSLWKNPMLASGPMSASECLAFDHVTCQWQGLSLKFSSCFPRPLLSQSTSCSHPRWRCLPLPRKSKP